MSIEPKHEDFEDEFAIKAKQRAQTFHDLTKAQRLVRNGWCQYAAKRKGPGVFFRRTEYCVTGAIAAACDDNLDRCILAINTLYSTAFSQYTRGGFCDNLASLQAWNDQKGMTKGAVLGAFDVALRAIRTA